MLLPRVVVFDSNGIAIGAGLPYQTAFIENEAYREIMDLPCKSYGFIDFDIRGKTEEQIRKEVSAAQCPCGNCKGCTGAACESD